MDEKLQQFGWRAVPITGFIPPAEFLEFLSLSILPIACVMRQLENLDYTPTPDIVHEAAGHAPIIADPTYASYLHKFGEIARNAIFAKEDLEVYEAVRNLSEVKESPKAKEEDIVAAQNQLDQALDRVTYVSEASQLSRLGWWSTEYGLLKQQNEFFIYGAGLLSSVGESYNCLSESVPKIPLTLDCIGQDFDITKPQPQLFYSESFQELENVIDELADSMAFRKGGLYGLSVAKKAQTVTTCELDSGLQISGVLSAFHHKDDQPYYLQFTGPTQLSREHKQIPSQGPSYHIHGYGTPLGPIEQLQVKPQDLTPIQLHDQLGFRPGQKGTLRFSSGVEVRGELIGTMQEGEKMLVLTFKDCTVQRGDQVFFQPEWGLFDMGCGTDVVSVFGGAADRSAYFKETTPYLRKPTPHRSNAVAQDSLLVELYQSLRDLREAPQASKDWATRVIELAHSLQTKFPADWLLRLEVIDLLKNQKALPELEQSLLNELLEIGRGSKKIQTLIERGLKIL